MKRDPALAPLSRDHHKALFVAQTLRRAEEVEGPAREFLEFWHEHGLNHFRVEEDVLFAAWAEADAEEGYEDEMVMRALADHHSIRRDARRIGAGRSSLNELHALGERLEAHVRFEEREMFPVIEATFGADALAALAGEIERAEAEPG